MGPEEQFAWADSSDYAIFFERETPADFLANVKKVNDREVEN